MINRKEEFSDNVYSYLSLLLLQEPQLMWGPCAYDPTANTLHSSLGGSGFIIMLCISFTCPMVGGAVLTNFM